MIELPERPTPGFLLWRVTMKWRAAVDRAVAPLGLTHAQYSLLASLYGLSRRGRHPSQRQLADHTGLDPIYVSKLVKVLERSGLVDRTVDPADARAVQLAVTARGDEVVRRAIRVVGALQEELTAPLGGLDSDRTANLVDELRTLLADIPAPPGGEP